MDCQELFCGRISQRELTLSEFGESLKEKVTVLKSGIVHCDNCVIVIVVTGDTLGELSELVNL